MGFLQSLTTYYSAPHEGQHRVSFSRELAVMEALFMSPRLAQLYSAVFAGLLLRRLKHSRPIIYRFIIISTHYICYSVCFDLATVAITYFRPQGQQDDTSEESEMAAFIVRDFWIAFLGHAFIAFAGAYSVQPMDVDQLLLNLLLMGSNVTLTVDGAGNLAVGSNPGNNNNWNNNSFAALLSAVASSFNSIFGLATSTTASLLPGISLATLNSVPILSTSFTWLFLLHHFPPTELLPLVAFPCLEVAAAWHGRLIAPWFSSASHAAFVYILITGWYNGTASWGITPFILLCLGKPFFILLFFAAIFPLAAIEVLGIKAVNRWRSWFPPTGVALAKEGPKVVSPSSISISPSGSQNSTGRPSQAEGKQPANSRKDDLLDELDDLIDDALEFGVDASYRQPMATSSSSLLPLSVFTRSRRNRPPSSSVQNASDNGTFSTGEHSEASLPSSSTMRPISSQKIDASRRPSTTLVEHHTSSARTGDECVYCWTSPRSVLLEPCAHLCLCDKCRNLLASKGENRCPVCRRDVEMYRRIYRA